MKDDAPIENKPLTHHVDVDQAMATLNYAEMLALASMFERWALTETKVDGAERTKLIQWSADYEAIAAFAGADWIASAPVPPSLLAFLAQRETAQRSDEDHVYP